MTTEYSFFHLASTVWLAKRCRRMMISLKKLLREEPEVFKKLTDGMGQGHIDDTNKYLDKIFEKYSEEEKGLINVEEDELKITKEEIQGLLKEKNKVNDLKELLKSKGFKDLADQLLTEEHTIDGITRSISKSIKNELVEALDIYRNREHRMKFYHLMSDKFLTGEAFQKISEEINEIKVSRQIENEFNGLIDKLSGEIKSEDNQNIREHTEKVIY